MDLGTLIIGAIILTVIVLPFVMIGKYSNKGDNNKDKNDGFNQ
jgi:heme/copper-type cytochrome/quinol oxidase subunit 2